MMRRRPQTTAPDKNTTVVVDDDATDTTNQHQQQQPLMDENDQDEMVLELKAEADRLQRQIHWFFSILCRTAMVICVLVALYRTLFPASTVTANDWTFLLLRWIHTGLAALLHWEAQYIVQHPAQSIFSWKLSVRVPIVATIGLLFVVVSLRHDTTTTTTSAGTDDSMLHWGLALSNAATLVGAIVLRLDSSSTADALEELKSSKYRYKSL
jgi:hypothetical protein